MQIHSHAHTLTQILTHPTQIDLYTRFHTPPRYTLSLTHQPERSPCFLLRYTHTHTSIQIGAHSLPYTHHSDTPTFAHIPSTDTTTLSHTHPILIHTHTSNIPYIHSHSTQLQPHLRGTPNSVHTHSHMQHSDIL